MNAQDKNPDSERVNEAIAEYEFQLGLDLILRSFSKLNSSQAQSLSYIYRDELLDVVLKSKGAIRKIDFY